MSLEAGPSQLPGQEDAHCTGEQVEAQCRAPGPWSLEVTSRAETRLRTSGSRAHLLPPAEPWPVLPRRGGSEAPSVGSGGGSPWCDAVTRWKRGSERHVSCGMEVLRQPGSSSPPDPHHLGPPRSYLDLLDFGDLCERRGTRAQNWGAGDAGAARSTHALESRGPRPSLTPLGPTSRVPGVKRTHNPKQVQAVSQTHAGLSVRGVGTPRCCRVVPLEEP